MIHTGGHTEYTPVGHAANLAARMQTVAPAGGIVIARIRGVWSRVTSNCATSGRLKSKASASQSTFTRWSAQDRCAAISNWRNGVG